MYFGVGGSARSMDEGGLSSFTCMMDVSDDVIENSLVDVLIDDGGSTATFILHPLCLCCVCTYIYNVMYSHGNKF